MSWWQGWWFWVERGNASWCGRFTIVHWPVRLSLAFGRGTSGLWVWRRTERGAGAIKAYKADKVRRRAAVPK